MAVKGLSGRQETCLKHPDRKAISRCATCHAPVCKECAVKRGKSIFCSESCAESAASFKESYKGPAKLSKGYGHRLVQAVIYIAILYGLLFILAVPMKMGFAQKILNLLPWHSFK